MTELLYVPTEGSVVSEGARVETRSHDRRIVTPMECPSK